MTQLDYAGIVVLLFGLTINLVAFALYDYNDQQMFTILIATSVFIANLIISFTKCAASCPGNHHKHFMTMQVITIVFLFGFVVVWYFNIATEVEIKLFFWPFIHSFGLSAVGFFFYRTRFPQKYIKEKKCGKCMAWTS